jgi:hypothetical protein
MKRPLHHLVCTGLLVCGSAVTAQEGFKLERDAHGVTVTIDGRLFTKYVIDQANKPYFHPVIGPTGAAMTRAYPMEEVAGEQRDHPHHRGICFGHLKVNGSNTWEEALTRAQRVAGKSPAEAAKILGELGATVHREFKTLAAKPDHAVMVTTDDYVDSKGVKYMLDERTYTFRAPDQNTRIIDIDIVLTTPSGGTVTLTDEKDAGLSIRVATELAVDSKRGGRLVNSAGQTDAECWGKRAKWCDYSGRLDGQAAGVAFLNHPDSFRFPTPWHARTYGLLTANPFGTKAIAGEQDGTITLKGDEKIVLRHRLLLHKGDCKTANIDAAWQAYAAERAEAKP